MAEANPSVTIVIPVKNEARNIASCIEKVNTMGPVLVVDYSAVFPATFSVSLPQVKIGTYDTRIKLRAGERKRSLSTEVRSEDQ